MNGNKKLPKADKFLEKRKKTKLWHRLLLIAGSIVVFITTYMLILPALTAEIGTLDVYDHVLSSAGVEVDNGDVVYDDQLNSGKDDDDITQDITEDSMAVTEESTVSIADDNKGTGGGGGSSGSVGDKVTSEDVTMDISLEKVDSDEEKEKEDPVNVLNNLVSMLANVDNSGLDEIEFYGKGDNKEYEAVYDPETGDFKVTLNIDFGVKKDSLYDNGVMPEAHDDYTRYYMIQLPAGIVIPDNMVYDSEAKTPFYYGYQTGTQNVVFDYCFVPAYDENGDVLKDEYGNTIYQVSMVFSENFINGLEGDEINGTMSIDALLSSDYHNKDDGSIIIKDGEKDVIKVDWDQISYGDNETMYHDVTVTKKGTYNSSDKTLTYTVMVMTKKGTGDTVTVNDTLDSAFLEKLGAQLQGIEYKQGTVGLYVDEWNKYVNESHTTYSESVPLTQTDTGTGYTYDSNGNMIINLPGLGASNGELYNPEWDTNTVNANAYCITYTYNVNPDADVTYTGDNSAKVDVVEQYTEGQVVISDTATAKVTVTGKSTLTKSGSYDKENQEITWTIVVGDGDNSVNGFTLNDEMFADATNGIQITDIDGNALAADTDYSFVYGDAENPDKITGVKLSNDDSAEDVKTQYIITYKTSGVQQWAGQNITNEAKLVTDDPDNPGDYKAQFTVHISGLSDCFTKKISLAEKNDDGTYTLNWTTDFSIPSQGISNGITFTDYVSGNGHYITKAQANSIITALNEAWGQDNIENIQFYTGTDRWNMSDDLWFSYDTLPDEAVCYQFRYTISKDIAYDSESTDENANKISYTYPTTADTSGIGDADNIIYYNNVYDSVVGTDKQANWTYYKEVVKYGNNNSGSITSSDDTTLTVTDGHVSWIARVVLLPGQTYKIVDSLPDGLDLVNIYAITNTTVPTEQLVTAEGAQVELTNNVSGKVILTYDGTDENNNISLTAVNDATNRNMLYIRYLCKINDSSDGTTVGTDSGDGSVSAGDIAKEYVLTNNITATTEDGDVYGSDDQTTTVIWQDEKASEEILSKDAQFDSNNNVIQYSLDINSNAINYVTSTGEAYSDIVVTDVLSYSSYPSAGIARDASLMLNSVALYYAEKDEQGNIIYDKDGKLIKETKLSSSEFTWTYDVNIEPNGYDERATKTLTLTVPNGTALVFEYQFLVTVITDSDDSWIDRGAHVNNSATMSVGGETIVSTTTIKTDDNVSDSGTSASANGTAGYTIYKVDKNNFSMPLAGAEFDLYVWSDATDADGNVTGKNFNKIDTFTTSSQGYTGITGTLKTNNDTGEKWYEIKLSDGSAYNLPVDTICYFVESKAPDGYKTDRNRKYYFYFGSTVATTLNTVLNSCGYNGTDTISSAFNLITSHTQYITNEHSWDYFAEKTGVSVVKRWLDSTGNAINKTDGSIKFKLYRVFTDVDGNQDYGPDYSGGDSGGGTVTNPTVTVNVKVGSSYEGINGAVSSNILEDKTKSIEVQRVDGAKVDITFTRGNLYAEGDLEVYDVDTAEKLNEVKLTSGDPLDYTYTLDVGGKNRNIFICFPGERLWGVDKLSLKSDQEYIETTTEPTSEAVTSDIETESTTTAFYYHVFDNDVLEFSTDSAGNDVEISHINGDKLVYKGSENEAVHDVNYFTINGSLSKSHGTTLWDLDGDGVINPDSDSLSTCLKMETNYGGTGSPTNISFTAKEGGVITLVFNANGNGNENITNSVYIDGTQYTATNNVVTTYLEAGEHTITRSSYCFMFYMSFEEGASENSTVSSKYIQNFNNGTSSTFYTISGSTANDKGTVIYDNVELSTCLKMNSKASITFDTAEAGTLYLILTNPNNHPEVGLVIDGVVHYASHELDPNGNDIFAVTTRVSEGSHTITRLNSTEAMLYYIEYVPDNFGSGEITDTPPSNKYADLVGEYSISAANNWSWSTANLLWQVLDDDGNLLGHYSYFVVEVDEEGNYKTQYLNSNSDGIQSGSMAIYNQDDSESATEITVSKNWLNVDGNPLDADLIPNSITYSLYSRVNVNPGQDYSGGEDYSRSFASTQKNETLTNDSDGFFIVSGDVTSSSRVGMLSFTPTKADNIISSRYYLKFDGKGKVNFSSPATSGILTLVTYNFSTTGFSGNKANIGYTLTSPSGKTYKFNYSETDSNGLAGTYPGSMSNAVETLAGDDTGVTITATSSSTLPEGDGIITFTIFTDEPGEWTITRNGAQEYLFYMDFSYQYQYLADGEGIHVNDYTVTAKDNWTQTVSGLPYIIYDDNGTEVGHYSYYIEEKDIEGFKLDTLTYLQVDDNGAVESAGPITSGSVDITNRQKNVSVLLPESGGIGTGRYIKTGLLMCICAGLLIYIRSKKLRE